MTPKARRAPLLALAGGQEELMGKKSSSIAGALLLCGLLGVPGCAVGAAGQGADPSGAREPGAPVSESVHRRSPQEVVEAYANPFLDWYEAVPVLLAEGEERRRLADAHERREGMDPMPEEVEEAIREDGCGPRSREVLTALFAGLGRGYEPLRALIARGADGELLAELAPLCGEGELDELRSLCFDTPGEAFRDHLARMLGGADLSEYDGAIAEELERRGLS